MAQIICGISGIKFRCEHIPMLLSRREMNHPIFHLPQRKLLELYKTYASNQLTETDAYLLFLALLHSTDVVVFSSPVLYTSVTPNIIAANIGQLVSSIWNTNAITHPGFKQPGFYVDSSTQDLSNISMWIKAWQSNIIRFKEGIVSERQEAALKEVTSKLERLILSPETVDTKLAAAVATWADKAAAFPVASRDYWKSVIRRCYNISSMFSVPRKDILEIRSYCEENLEVGSIYFNTLMKTLKTGLRNHYDFLGMEDLDSPGYVFVDSPSSSSKEQEILAAIAATAPTSPPVASDYPSKLAFVKARLAYKTSQRMLKELAKT